VLLNGWYDGDDAELPIHKVNDNNGSENTVLYKADYPQLRAIDDDGSQKWTKAGYEASVRWTPSIHMPRWASRITLEITDVRVQRLRELSESEAEAEGVEFCSDAMDFGKTVGGYLHNHVQGGSYFAAFIKLWNKINGKKHSWESNPWVWVIQFEKLS
jgi:hypothetical protein